MKNKILIVILALAILASAGFIYSYFNGINLGIKEKINEPTTNLIGGDRDAHGCIGSAGYSWCEIKNKCLRIWEEKCELVKVTNNLRKESETCGDKIGNCAAGLECMYPCGVQGCQNICLPIGSPPRP